MFHVKLCCDVYPCNNVAGYVIDSLNGLPMAMCYDCALYNGWIVGASERVHDIDSEQGQVLLVKRALLQ